MTAWSRRDVLQAIGAMPALAACGAGAARVRRAAGSAPDLVDLRGDLREVVAGLQRKFADASGAIVSNVRTVAHVDAGGRGLDTTHAVRAVFRWTDAGRSIAVATHDATEAGLSAVLDQVGARREATGAFGQPGEYHRGDVRDLSPAQWLTPLARAYKRVRGRGGSRVVYRRAFTHSEIIEALHVGPGVDARQRIGRTRTGVVFVGAAGTATYAETAERAGTRSIDDLDVPDAALSNAADDALALLTARAIAPREVQLLFDASATAALVYGAIAPAFEAERWRSGASQAAALVGQTVGPASLSLANDPLLDGGYGSHDIEPHGRRAARGAWIEGGVVVGPAAAAASNLVLTPGTASRDDLLAAVDDGLLLEGGMTAHVEPARWLATVRVARAREIAKGKLTGRLFGPVLVRGSVASLLEHVAGISATTEHRAVDHGVAVQAPMVLTRGKVVPG